MLSSLILMILLGVCFSQCLHNMFPTTGTWTLKRPHWTPNGCQIKVLTQEEATQCLKGKTVYVVGSSIARNYAFQLASILGANDVTRDEQKNKCDKGSSMTWEGCVDEINGVKFKYMYTQYMDGIDYSGRGGISPFAWKTTEASIAKAKSKKKMHILQSEPHLLSVRESEAEFKKLWGSNYTEICWNKSAYDCLSPFLNGSQPSDILLLSGMGLENGRHLRPKPPIDYYKWLTISGQHFADAINKLFNGRIIRGTISEVLDNPRTILNPSKMLYETEIHLSRLFTNYKSSSSWYTIDQWSINHGRTMLYTDSVHFPGMLSTAFLDVMLTELCK